MIFIGDNNMLKKKNKPKFNVMNYKFMKSVKERWRRPRGNDNKKRIRAAFTGACPRVGYRTPPSLRHLHPLGVQEILVNNVSQVDAAINNKLVRIAAAVGAKKRAAIVAKAKQLGLIVLNPNIKDTKFQDTKEMKKGN